MDNTPCCESIDKLPADPASFRAVRIGTPVTRPRQNFNAALQDAVVSLECAAALFCSVVIYSPFYPYLLRCYITQVLIAASADIGQVNA